MRVLPKHPLFPAVDGRCGGVEGVTTAAVVLFFGRQCAGRAVVDWGSVCVCVQVFRMVCLTAHAGWVL